MIIAIALNVAFWLFIASYNPPPRLFLASTVVGLMLSAPRYHASLNVSHRLNIPEPSVLWTMATSVIGCTVWALLAWCAVWLFRRISAQP